MKLLLATAMVCIASMCFAQKNPPAPSNEIIVEQQPYSFPAYEKAKRIERYFSKEAYEAIINDANFEMQTLTYLSDGLKVKTYVYKPQQGQEKKLPAIIFNRGGYLADDEPYMLAPFFHRLALEGFVILAPQLRESAGGEGKDEVGGADLNDVMNMLPVAKSLGYIDTNNLFMYGESRGGMMAYQAIRDGFPINAAAVYGAFTDFNTLLTAHPEVYLPLSKKIWPDFDENKGEIIKRRSVMQWAEKINVPVFIMHGGADQTVDPSESLNIAQRLQQLGKPYGLVIYPFDKHSLPMNEINRDKQTIAWFKKFLKN